MEPRQQIRKAAADHSVKRKPAGKEPQQNKKTRAANNVNDEKGPKNDKDENVDGEMLKMDVKVMDKEYRDQLKAKASAGETVPRRREGF